MERVYPVEKLIFVGDFCGFLCSRLCGPFRLVPLDLLVLLRLLILLPLAINGFPFLGVHSKLLLGPVTVLRVVSSVTGDLNVFRGRVDRKVIRIAGDYLLRIKVSVTFPLISLRLIL